MNNFNAPLSNVVYATGQMRNYELTFSIINLLIIPISFVVLKMGAPAEAVFIVYFIMTIFVQLGCFLVLKEIVTLSLRQYCKKLLAPLFMVAALSVLILYVIHIILPHNIVGIGIEYICVVFISGVLFYLISLDAAEKNIVSSIIKKLQKK